jgi:hypothetical protein
MGTWGPGSFQSDGALDYVGEVIDSLVARIEEILDDEGRVALDEEGEAVLVPSVHIIGLLVEHCRAAPPKPATVKEWHKKYLKVFDDQIDGLSPTGNFEAERRKVIEDTFAKLEAIAQDFWKK